MASSRCAPDAPEVGTVQALARRIIMLLSRVSFRLHCGWEGWEFVLELELELEEAAVRHLSKDKCCLALLKVERNCELRGFPALIEVTLMLVWSSSVNTLAQSDDAEEDASQTTLTDTPKANENQVQLFHMEEEREVSLFVVPKMSLNFRLTLKIGDLNNEDDEESNEDLELVD